MNVSKATGFTLVELMIVVVVMGVLAAIAIPNYTSFKQRAQEGAVKSNMHTVQLVVEDFSVQNDGDYPTSSSAALPDGRTLPQLFPTGNYPINPLTHLPSVIQFNLNPTAGNPGELAINPAQTTGYFIKANGPLGDTLRLVLSTGQ